MLCFIRFRTQTEDTSLEYSFLFLHLYQPLLRTHTKEEWLSPIYFSPEINLRDVLLFHPHCHVTAIRSHLNSHIYFLTSFPAPSPSPLPFPALSPADPLGYRAMCVRYYFDRITIQLKNLSWFPMKCLHIYMPVSLSSKGRIYVFMTSDSHIYSKYSKNNENENII